MRRVYQVASAIMILFGVWVMWESHGMTLYDEMGPGGGFFPFWLAAAFVLLAAIWFFQVSTQPQASADGFFPDRSGTLRILFIIGAMAAFVPLADTIGFQLSMFAFLMFLFLALGRQNLLITLVISVVGSFGVYYVFGHMLEVPLPAASIDFLANLGL